MSRIIDFKLPPTTWPHASGFTRQVANNKPFRIPYLNNSKGSLISPIWRYIVGTRPSDLNRAIRNMLLPTSYVHGIIRCILPLAINKERRSPPHRLNDCFWLAASRSSCRNVDLWVPITSCFQQDRGGDSKREPPSLPSLSFAPTKRGDASGRGAKTLSALPLPVFPSLPDALILL